MSLAKLFYLKETFRENVRQWRQACFRRHSQLRREQRFALETLEPRVLLSATPTEVVAPQQLESAAVTVPAGNLPNLDIDLNGQADALSDGIIIIRHLFGFTGSALTDGAVDPLGQRTDPTAIQNYLNSITSALDIDLNQSADALSDGIVIIRSLFGFTGAALTEGAIDPGGGRTDPIILAAFLDNMNPQRELLAPVVTAGLQQDTGLSASDTITLNPTITGTVADINQIASFTAGFDATPVGSFVDVLADLQTTGSFTLSTARLNQIAGGALADGTHTLHLRVTDARGNVATVDRAFTLDRVAPAQPTFDLAVTSDTGTIGDQQTTAAVVTLKGQSDPTTSIQLLGSGIGTLSNGLGTFQLPDIALAVGANAFTVRASDVAGNQSDFLRTITRVAAAPQADVVLDWSQTMLEAVRLDATPPSMASRGMAMVSLAMYDAINAIEGTPSYYVALTAPPDTSPEAAAAAAAHRVLSYLYPGQQALFDSALTASLEQVVNGPGETQGIALGRAIGDAIVAIRSTDGWDDFVDYVPGGQPGDWQQTAPMFDVALLPQWADLTPFALTSPTQFRPAGPPALTSQAYTDAFNEVKALGSATGSTRTADQTEIARFWADGAGTYTPPGHWNQIAAQIALQQGNSLSANARLFAQLNVALADAGIAAWDAKYAYESWRPITAIQQAAVDGNTATIADPTWTSFLITPPFPEYTSGHSTFSGAAAEILTSLFGANVAFTTTSLGLPNVQRNFTSFEQAAQEAGRSRIYGGIHFQFANQDGLTAGKALAQHVLSRFTVTTDTQGPTIVLDATRTPAVTKTNLTIQGQVLDNLSGIAALQAKLDNGAFAPIAFTSTGDFTFATTLSLDATSDGQHTVTFQARDNQNNLTTLVFIFTLDTKAPVITLTSPVDNATLTATSRLAGTADATGSKLTELCYKFDNGTLVPVSFDPTTGSFDIPLDLSRLAVGDHTVSLQARDAAGNVTTVTRNVNLAAPIPLTIIGVTPQPGASDVGSTFRPQVTFSRPINPSTLNTNNFYATDTTGAKLTASIVPAQDGTFAWLFFTNPMPSASTITLHVDGTTIFAAGDGQALDADANGTPGGTFISSFTTVSLNLNQETNILDLDGNVIATTNSTTLSGIVLDPGPDLKMMTFDDILAGADGVLHTSDDVFLNPIANATVFILGRESEPVLTDAQGRFSFDAVPAGNIKLAIDGRTATNAPVGYFFPEMVMDLEIEIGQANTVMGTMGTREEKEANLTRPEVYLPRVPTSILQTVSDTEATVIRATAEGAPNLTEEQRQLLTITVQPKSLIGFDGKVITNGRVGISTVPPELVRDMLPSGLMQLSATLTLQAPGVAKFAVPVAFTFPNIYGAAPGSQVFFYSFDHDTGRLVIEGTATVSPDGKVITSDPGSGITKPGWHGPTPPGVTAKNKLKLQSVVKPARFDGFNEDENGNPLPDNVRRQTPKVKLADVDPRLTNPEFLSQLQDIFASVLMDADFDMNINSARDQHPTKPNSRHNHGTALDISSRGSDGRILDQVTRDRIGSQIADTLRQRFPEVSPRILHQNDNGTAPSWASPIVDGIDHFHVDLGRTSTYPIAPNDVFLVTSVSSLAEVSEAGTEFNPRFGRIYDPSGMAEFRFTVGPGGEWSETLVPQDRMMFLELYDPDAKLLLQRDFWTGTSGGSVAPLEQTSEALREYQMSQLRAAPSFLIDPDESFSFTPTDEDYLVKVTKDSDLDGLPDGGEWVIGTSSDRSDSDGDGIKDGVEVLQGLDPFGSRSFVTGVTHALSLFGEAKEVILEGSVNAVERQIAFIATGSRGFAIVEAVQSLRPIVLSQLNLPGDTTDASVDTRLGIAVAASNAGGLHFIDVSSLAVPILSGTVATNASQVEVSDGFAYVTVGGDLRSYSLLTGELVSSVSLSTGSLVGLAREGNTLYTTDNLNVLQATTTVAGVLTARDFLTIPLGPGQSAGKVFVGNGVAYVGAQGNFSAGFATADVSDPDDLVLLSGVDAANIQGRRIVANGSGLGVTVGNVRGPQGPIFSLDVVSLADPTNTGNFLTRFALPAEPFSVAIGAGIAFVADGTGGLQVVNYRAFDNQGVAPTVSITSPVVDLDPVAAGIQVTEGSAIPVRVNAADDVQVRNVEMLVNGVVASNDVSFPFELSAIALGSTPSANTTTVQVRATDTGGNIALSNTLTFQLVPDTFPPTLVGRNLANGAIKDKSFRTIQFQFSEPIDATKVTAQNFQLLDPLGSAVMPTAIQLLSGGAVVQLTYDPLSLGTHQFVIKSANVTDRAGNALASQDVVIPFQIFSNVVPALNPLPPLASRIYVQNVAGHIDAPLASESFTISLDAGQKVTMGVSPDSASLRPRIELLDGTGAVLGSAESVGIGEGLTLQAVSVPTTGIYTLRVQSISGTGPFRGVVYLNALQENEFFGGPTNDTLATAMALSPSSLPLQGTADRMAVVGVADGGDDFYRLDLAQNQTMFTVLRAFGGGDIELELRDSAGNLLTIGQVAGVPSISTGIFAFQAPAAGTYYLNVTGLPEPDPVIGIPQYSLVVTRAAAFEYLSNDTPATAQAFALTGQALGSVGTRVFPQVGATIPDAVDYYSFLANAGDQLQIMTTTPGDGAGEPANTLDPALQLFDPAGTLVASDQNSAPDGRNAVISTTAAATGLYKIAVLPAAGAGDYTVRVTGATGQASFNFQVSTSAIRTNATQATAVLSFTIPPLLSSIVAGDVTINGVAATSFDVVDAVTLRFHASGVTPVGGGYTVDLQAGAIQDLHGNGNPAFSRLFTGDTIAPVVTASSINAMSVIEPNAPGTFTPLTITFTFSEPIDQATLSTDDVQLQWGIASEGFDSPVNNAAAISYNAASNQLMASFNTLPENDLMTLTLFGGPNGIRDLAGNPLNGAPSFPLPSGQGHPAIDNYVVEFGVGPAAPSFEPFEADLPTGSLLYFGRELVSTFATAGETDVWTVDLKAGQTMGISLTPTSGIQGRLTVVDPNGMTLATKSGALGRPVAMGDIPIATAGTYRIEVTTLAGVGVYAVGFALDTAFDVEYAFLDSVATNNTILTAQSLAVSTIPLQGTASRLAAEGEIASSFDADLYSFQAGAGQPLTLFVKDFSSTATMKLELLKFDGSVLATGALALDGTVRISDYVVTETGTYLARITCFDGTPEYNLVVTRGASFERAGNSPLAQDVSLSDQVLGGLDKQGQGLNGAIRVAVLGAGAAAIVGQLNDDTLHDFDAVAVESTAIDTIDELSAYDVVVVGDPGSRFQLQGIEQTLNQWFWSGQGALVGVGGLVQAAGPAGGFTLGWLDSVIPINLNALSTETTNPTLTIGSTVHEVTQGLSSFAVTGKVERPAGTIDQNAVLLGTTDGAPSVVTYDPSEWELGPRSAFVGPMYFDSSATGLRSGSADRLLEQTIAWASHVDIVDAYRVSANAGDQLVIGTSTPFGGPLLPQNLLDPRLELLNPLGAIVASNDNGAPDGKNALINYTVPAGEGGQYTIRVRGNQAGEYTLAVTGTTGTPALNSLEGTSPENAGAVLNTSSEEGSFDGSLAYVQQSWVKDFLSEPAKDDEDLTVDLLEVGA